MSYKTYTKAEALKIWEHEFGNVLYAYDFTGRKVKKDDYLVKNKDRIVGVFLTHAHVDHIWNAAYIQKLYNEFEFDGELDLI